MSEIVKKKVQPLDNFADFDDSVQTVDGDTDQSVGPRLVGVRLKFTNRATWETPEGTDLTGCILLAANIRRTEVKWGDTAPITVRELEPGDKYRDLDAVNETIPKSEWRKGPDGKLRGPWERQHVVEFVDIATMERFSWPTNTIGGGKAIIELRDRILLMRRFRGINVYPLVALSDTFMPTRHGGRQRPHLPVKDWRRITEGGLEPVSADAQPRLPAPAEAPSFPASTPPWTAETSPNAPPAKPAASQQAPTLQAVCEPTTAEEMNDDLPDFVKG
jgi:hypothetical protein